MLHETVFIGSEGGGSRNWLGQVVDETAKPVTFVPPPPSCQVTTPVGRAGPTAVLRLARLRLCTLSAIDTAVVVLSCRVNEVPGPDHLYVSDSTVCPLYRPGTVSSRLNAPLEPGRSIRPVASFRSAVNVSSAVRAAAACAREDAAPCAPLTSRLRLPSAARKSTFTEDPTAITMIATITMLMDISVSVKPARHERAVPRPIVARAARPWPSTLGTRYFPMLPSGLSLRVQYSRAAACP